MNRYNILFAQLELVTTKPSVQTLFSLHLVLIYVDNDAKNVAMVCFRSVDMWNRDSHTVSLSTSPCPDSNMRAVVVALF